MEEENVEKVMTPILLEDLGMRYPTEKSKKKRRYGLYQCQYCRKEFETQIQSIKNGNTKSCGCQVKTNRKTHGLTQHRLYKTWNNMRTRCYNINNDYYLEYGARGIQICDRWLDINNFIEDMYPSYIEGLSLDRIDVDGSYEPDNCRWTTNQIQGRNTRELRITNTSGYRGIYWNKNNNKWRAQIRVNNTRIHLGSYKTAIEAGKAYETYVRLNNLEHNFTSILNEEEIEEINIKKEIQ